MSDVNVTEETSKSYKATKRLYLDKNKERIVEENDPKAAFLLAAEGQEVSQGDVEKYGLAQSAEPEGDSEQPTSEAPQAESDVTVEPTSQKADSPKAGKKARKANTDPVKAQKARK